VRHALFALALTLSGAGSFAVEAAAVEVLVRPAEGAEVSGELLELNAKSLVVKARAGGDRKSFKLAELMGVEVLKVKAPDASDCARIYTVSGDQIPAKISTGSGKLTAAGPWTEKFEISTKDLSGILLPAGLKDKKACEAFAGRAGSKSDHLYLLGDDFKGSFEGLSKTGVKFKSFLGAEDYKLGNIAALRFAELKPFVKPTKTYFVVELAGGGRVSGFPVKLAGGKLAWKTLGGMKLTLKLAGVSALRVVNGKVVFLSEMKPEKVEQKPFIQGLPFIWAWRRDQDVFRKPLRLGGKSFSRGLGMAAYTKLIFRLDGKYKRFKAAAGISDSVAAGGKTVFKVLVDGKARFDNTRKPLSKGAKLRMVDVEVSGAKVLELVVDFGPDGSDLGDIGGWGEARLIK
jgi:NPCBM/NEW2 domain